MEINSRNVMLMCYGNFRNVKFAQFLVENYFPRRDELAYIEAGSFEERILKSK